jgi:outer membrane lipoprotein SlyB
LEFEDSETNLLFRAGLGYEFELRPRLSLAPEFNVDFGETRCFIKIGELLMKIKLLIIVAAMTCLSITSLYAQSVTIQYGTVEGVRTISKDARHAGGALAGGVIGAMIGPRRHRGIRVLTGAAIGAAVQGSATSGTQQQYTVSLLNGGTTIINTEQQDIRIGDCVSIEQGSYSNIRRISSVHCETKTQTPQHHKSSSSDCQKAKHELTNAETDEAITMAAKKVRILCED